MARSNVIRKKIISVRDQRARLQLLYPSFTTRVCGAVLTVEGVTQPTCRSEAYRFRVEYEAWEPPRVWVLDPPLKPREEDGCIPHMYEQERLCLYLPNSGEWSGEMSLAHTIIPWIADWLFYYEVWHATGKWLGGGLEPANNKTIRREEGEKTYEQERE